jgi:hypothetical protein
MTERTNQSGTIPIDELPDRVAHRRKIARRIARDTPEYAADHPSRSADISDSGYRVLGPQDAGSGRGPHA